MIIALLACTPAPVDTVDSAVEWPEVPVEEVEGWSDPSDWIFTHKRVHTVDIRLDEEDIASLEVDRGVYVEADVQFDDTLLPSVGVRLKGRIGSFRELSGKSSFKLDLNRFLPEQQFYGLESLTLNNAVVDCSFTKEHLAYRV